MNVISPLPPSMIRSRSLEPRGSRALVLGATAFVLALASTGCNAVLGIDDASLCGGEACDGGVPPFVSSEQRPNLPSPARGLGSSADAGSFDASAPLGGGTTTDGVIAPAGPALDPGSSPADTNGNGASSGNNGAGDGANGGSSDGSGDGNPGEGAPGNGNGNGNSGEGDPGNGSSGAGNAGSGDGSAGGSDGSGGEPPPTTTPPTTTPPPTTPPPTTPPPTTPPPTTPPPVEPPPAPTPCDGRAVGDAFCDGVTRISCGAAGVVTSAVACPSAAHCAAGTGGACAVCLLGEATCAGASLIACNATQTALETSNCAGPAQCNAALARCDAPTCGPNALQCDGAVLEICNATLSGFDPIADCGVPAACNVQTGGCNLCTPGALRCIDDATVGVCDPTGQFETPTRCGVLEACTGGECVLFGVPGLPGL